jgi:RNA polymerase sigma-70 factor, ECF subfamily
MSAGAGPRPGRAERPAWGLRALAELINDALAAMGTQPAFALAGPQVMHSALESPSVPHSSGPIRGRASRNLHPSGSSPRPSPRPSPKPGPQPTPPPGSGEPAASGTRPPADSPEVDETHVETWRLVGLAQEGDGEAFGLLYDRYVDTVFRFIYFRVNDRGLAEDFTSETFLRALRRIGTISYQGRDIGAWFITIARNIVLDHLKSARHRLEMTTADTIEGKEHAQSTEAAVLDTLQSERLMQAVGQLGDEQRECVMLRFVQGMSVSETAAIMGKNDGAIKALQHRAVRKLADIVGNELR